MPQPVSYNPGTPVSGSIQENSISYVVDGQNRNYRGGFGGLSWMSEVPASNNVIFIGNSISLGRGPANIPLFYPSYNNSAANIIYAANTLPGSPRNFTTTGSAYNWAATNNFFINNSDNPIPRIDADGLGLYLDASQPTSYPQTGTTWYDMSGKGTNGTLQNGVNWIASSGSFFFDGTDDYVSLGNLGTIGDTQTVEVWFNSNSVTSYKNVLDMNYSTYNPNTGNVGPRLEQTSGAGINWIWSGNTTNNGIYNFTPQISISSNKWYHTIFTLNSGNWNWYLNGNLEYSGTSPQGYVTTYGDVNLGRGFILDPARYFSGLESSARIYSRALSTSDVKQNYFQSNIVQDGLIFMIDANNLVSYPKSGTSTYSLTGSITGTLTNGVGYNPQNGGTWVFDGVDDFITTSLVTSTNNNVTIEAWFNSNNVNQAGQMVVYNGSDNAGNGYGISVNYEGSTTGNIYVLYGAISWFDTGVPLISNQWYHAIMTISGTSLKVYLNGVLIYNVSSSNPNTPTLYTNIGRNDYPAARYFNGKIANTKIYNRALTATEVQQNYQATKDKFLDQNIVTNGLVAYLDAANKDSYPGTGTTWYDLSGNGNNFTLYNSPYFNAAGGFFTLDGVDDWIRSTNTLNLSGTNTATVVILFKPNSYPSSGPLDFVFEHTANFNSNTGGFVHTYNDTSLGQNYQIFLSNRGNASYNIGVWDKSNYDNLNWKQSTLVIDRAQSSIENLFYLQGSPVTALSNPFPGYSGNNTNNFANDYFYIGCRGGSSYFSDLNIAAIAIYNRALSSIEISQVYNVFKRHGA